MNRRSEPDVSHTPPRMPGNWDSRASITPCTVVASNSTSSAPRVYLRRGAGITTFCDIDIFSLSDGAGDGVNYRLEGGQFRLNDGSRFKLQGILRLQTITCYREHGDITFPDSSLSGQLLRDRDGHATSSFREDSFGFGEQPDTVDDFLIRYVLGPSAGLSD